MGIGYDHFFMADPDGELTARSITDGTQRWMLSTQYFSIPRTPIIQKDMVLLGLGNFIGKYNPYTGSSLGQFPFGGGRISRDITVAQETVFASFQNGTAPSYTKGTVKALDINNFQILWISDQRNDFSTTPCVITQSGKTHQGGLVF